MARQISQNLRCKLRRLLRWSLGISLIIFLVACQEGNRLALGSSVNRTHIATTINSRYQEAQPALSGNGRFLAFGSDRNGSSQIWLYDRKGQVADLRLPQSAITESPSLSRTGRYLVYLSSLKGRPQVFLYDRVANRSEDLTPKERSLIRNPRISPDGRYIVVETARRGQWDIEIIDRGSKIELDIVDGSSIDNP